MTASYSASKLFEITHNYLQIMRANYQKKQPTFVQKVS